MNLSRADAMTRLRNARNLQPGEGTMQVATGIVDAILEAEALSYTVEQTGTFEFYGCAKRGCDAVNPDYLSFGGRGKGWCLHHIPLRSRLRVWWHERRNP